MIYSIPGRKIYHILILFEITITMYNINYGYIFSSFYADTAND